MLRRRAPMTPIVKLEPIDMYLLGGGVFLCGSGLYTLILAVRDFLVPVGATITPLLVTRATAMPLVLTLLGLVGLYHWQHQWRCQQKRQRAAHGDVTGVSMLRLPALANEVPVELPLVLVLRTRPTALLAAAGFWFVVVGLFIGALELSEGTGWSLSLLAGVGAASAVIVSLFLVALWLSAASATITITAYDQGLLVRNRIGSGGSGYLRWDEVRLFAVSPLGRRGTPPLRYELASERRIVHLPRAQRHLAFHPSQADTMVQPEIGFAAY